MEKDRRISLPEMIKRTYLVAEELMIIGRMEKEILVHDPTKPEDEAWRKGDYFALLPKELVQALPGSTLLAGEFIKELGEVEESVIQVLEGKHRYEEDNKLALEHEDENFRLKVYNGSVNERALHLSKLATEDFENDETRAKYQKTAAEIAKPILEERSEYDVRIVEDVIASGETIAGVLAILKRRGDIGDNAIVRVDVIAATTQGLLVLRKFAKDNNITLDIRVGYLAYGLSEGQEIQGTDARAHANYVTYPKEFLNKLDEETRGRLEDLRGNDENIHVVGDMGDAFQSLPDDLDEMYPWNKYRHDDEHGVRSNKKPQQQEGLEEEQTRSKAIVYYFANGGYFVRSLMRWWRLDVDKGIMLSAKRVWTDKDVKVDEVPLDDTEGSYGVLVKIL